MCDVKKKLSRSLMYGCRMLCLLAPKGGKRETAFIESTVKPEEAINFSRQLSNLKALGWKDNPYEVHSEEL